MVSGITANLPLLYVLWRQRNQPLGLDALAGIIGQSPSQFLFLPIIFPLIALFTARAFWMVEELRARSPLRRGWIRRLFAPAWAILLLGSLISGLSVGRDFSRKPLSEHDLFYLEKDQAWMAGLANQVVFRQSDPTRLAVQARRWLDTASDAELTALYGLPARYLTLVEARESSHLPSPEEASRFLALCYDRRQPDRAQRLPLDDVMRRLDFIAIFNVHIVAWFLVSYVFVLGSYMRVTPSGRGIFVPLFRTLTYGVGLFGAWLGLRYYGMREIESFISGAHYGRADLVPVLFLVILVCVFLGYLLLNWLEAPERKTGRFFAFQLLPAFLPAAGFGLLAILDLPWLRYLIGPGLDWDRLLITFVLMFVVAGLAIVAAPHSAPFQTTDFPVIRHCLFVSYSHRDAAWCLLFKKFLEADTRRGEVVVWLDQAILSAEDFRSRIRRAIDESRAVLLIVSSRFVAGSEFLFNEELPYLRRTREELGESFKVFWIKVDNCSFDDPLIENTQALSDPSRPLDRLPIRDLEAVLRRSAGDIVAALKH